MPRYLRLLLVAAMWLPGGAFAQDGSGIVAQPEWLAWVGPGVAILAFGVSLWSLYIAWANRRIAQGNAVSRLLVDYADPEMAKAVDIISLARLPITTQVENGYPDRTGEGWSKLAPFQDGIRLALKAKYVGIPSISGVREENLYPLMETAGRRLHWWVRQADILRRNGVLSNQLFRDAVTETIGYRVWTEVWLAYLEKIAEPKQPAQHLAWARKLIRTYPPIGGTY